MYRLDRLCPCCGHLQMNVEAAPSCEDRRPKEGDLCLCVACGHFNRFLADGALRPPTKAEHHSDQRSPRRMRAIIAHLRMAIDHHDTRIGSA